MERAVGSCLLQDGPDPCTDGCTMCGREGGNAAGGGERGSARRKHPLPSSSANGNGPLYLCIVINDQR